MTADNFLLFMGCIMEVTALLVILVPVLAPPAFALGIDKESMPFIWSVVVVLFFVTYVPWSYMWLVDLIGPR
jgi:TRAP-type C4-dicarboxylate transport system permease large subunit